MLDSTLATMGWVVSNYLIAGRSRRPMGNDNFTAAPRAPSRPRRPAQHRRQQAGAVRGPGRCHRPPDLATDPRFAKREARKANRAELTVEIEAALAARSAAEWEPSSTPSACPPAGC
jgi:CoA:oxalate CoA-transferase